MAEEVFRHRRLRAHRNAVPAMPPLLHVRRANLEHAALPFASGESHPRVRGFSGRVFTAIEPDDALLRVGAQEVL